MLWNIDYSETCIKRTPFPSVRLLEAVRRIGVYYRGKYHDDANFGTRLSVCLTEDVRSIGVLLIEVSRYKIKK